MKKIEIKKWKSFKLINHKIPAISSILFKSLPLNGFVGKFDFTAFSGLRSIFLSIS